MKKYFAYMLNISSKYKWKFIQIFLLSILMYSVSIITSLVGAKLIDSLRQFNITSMIQIILISSGLFILGGVISYFSSLMQTKTINLLKNEMRMEYYSKVQTADYNTVRKMSVSEVYQRMFLDINISLDYFLLLTITVPINIIIIIVITIIMITLSLELALFLVVFCLVQTIIVRIFKNPLRKVGKKKIDSDQLLIRIMSESFNRNDFTRSMGMETQILQNLDENMHQNLKKTVKQVSLSSIISNVLGFFGQIVSFVLILIGVYLVMAEKLTIGNLFFIFSISGHFAKAMVLVLDSIPSFQGVKIHFNRYKDIQDKFDIHRREFKYDKMPIFENIYFKGISFSYGSKEVIKGLEYKIEKDSITLIRGDNGAGKTTLLQIIRRFLYPKEGAVYLDNFNISDIKYEEYVKQVAFMMNEDYLLEDTVRNNLTLNDSFSEDEITEVIKLCHLEDLISRLPLGIETKIGLMFGNLSSGEKRKLSLARMLIRKPMILLLDEPTAHIDQTDINHIILSIETYQKRMKNVIIICSHEEKIMKISHKILEMQI